MQRKEILTRLFKIWQFKYRVEEKTAVLENLVEIKEAHFAFRLMRLHGVVRHKLAMLSVLREN